MTMIVADALTEDELLATRRERGLDLYDEVWDGMYVMHALPNDEHQDIVATLLHALVETIQIAKLGKVRPGVNLASDPTNWKNDYRCPDVVVFLNDTSATCHGAFWTGGPDLAVEILSPRDQTPSKLDFYSKIGTRELLVIDRDPWQLEFYRHNGDDLQFVAAGKLGGEAITSESLPISLQLVEGEERPQVIVRHSESGQEWMI